MQFCTAFSLTYVHQSFWLSLYFFIFLHSFMVWPVSAWRMIYLNYQWHEMNWFSRFFFSFFSFNHFWSAIVIELLGFWHWAFGSSQKGVCCPIDHCGCRRNWHLQWHFFTPLTAPEMYNRLDSLWRQFKGERLPTHVPRSWLNEVSITYMHRQFCIECTSIESIYGEIGVILSLIIIVVEYVADFQ